MASDVLPGSSEEHSQLLRTMRRERQNFRDRGAQLSSFSFLGLCEVFFFSFLFLLISPEWPKLSRAYLMAEKVATILPGFFIFKTTVPKLSGTYPWGSSHKTEGQLNLSSISRMYTFPPCKFTHYKILKNAFHFPIHTELRGRESRGEVRRASRSLLQNWDPLNPQTHSKETRLGSQAPFMMGETTVFIAH